MVVASKQAPSMINREMSAHLKPRSHPPHSTAVRSQLSQCANFLVNDKRHHNCDNYLRPNKLPGLQTIMHLSLGVSVRSCVCQVCTWDWESGENFATLANKNVEI